jgi:aminopeptidase YwaD
MQAPNSDHYYFSEHDVKAFFFYLLGTYPYYHDFYDTPDKPTFAGYNGAFKLIVGFLKTF